MAIQSIMSDFYEPTQFADPFTNGQMARDIWLWRYSHSPSPDTSSALPYAYSGWTTYRKARIDTVPQYVKAWNELFIRAQAATGWPLKGV
jgi:hypothetical protein